VFDGGLDETPSLIQYESFVHQKGLLGAPYRNEDTDTLFQTVVDALLLG
jgi:hypothetical protein